jgi:Flp pilus assembly protein TadB
MGIWILLSLVSGFALYVAISLNRPILIAATAVATSLGLLMLVLHVFLARKIQRETRRR